MMPRNMPELFQALVNQGGPSSTGPDNQCLYRGPQGRKCAAGWLIRDEDYRKEFEGRKIEDLLEKGLVKIGRAHV